jgi:Ca2+-dependent lipid-binding protein
LETMTDIEFFMIRASNLESDDGPLNKSDPYVYIQLEGCEPLRSATVESSLNPEWNEVLTFSGVVNPAAKVLDIAIYDDDTFKDDKIGGYKLDLGTLMQTDEPQEFEVVVDDGWFSNATLTFTVKLDGTWGNPPPSKTGDLSVKVIKCVGLEDADFGGTTDPYVLLKIDGCDDLLTDKKEGTINPEWDQELTFEGIQEPLSKTLKIRIYDDDTWSRDDKIGECEVDLAELKASEEKEYEVVVDMALFGLLRKATLSFTLKAQGWGNFLE